jgi:hypothetical protein
VETALCRCGKLQADLSDGGTGDAGKELIKKVETDTHSILFSTAHEDKIQQTLV